MVCRQHEQSDDVAAEPPFRFGNPALFQQKKTQVGRGFGKTGVDCLAPPQLGFAEFAQPHLVDGQRVHRVRDVVLSSLLPPGLGSSEVTTTFQQVPEIVHGERVACFSGLAGPVFRRFEVRHVVERPSQCCHRLDVTLFRKRPQLVRCFVGIGLLVHGLQELGRFRHTAAFCQAPPTFGFLVVTTPFGKLTEDVRRLVGALVGSQSQPVLGFFDLPVPGEQ